MTNTASRTSAPRVLYVDDSTAEIDSLSYYLERESSASVATTSPHDAIQSMRNSLFDMVVCDARLPYLGQEYGGLSLARAVQDILGPTGVICISRLLDDRHFSQTGLRCSFLEHREADGIIRFYEEVVTPRVRDSLSTQYAFVAMPFSRKFDRVYERISEGLAAYGMKPRRLDKRAFTSSIRARMFTAIDDAHCVLVDVTDSNPNVLYEAGYALARHKHIIFLARNGSALPFDIGDFQVHRYSAPRDLASLIPDILHSLSAPE